MADVCKGSQMCFCQHTMLIMVKLVLPGVFKETRLKSPLGESNVGEVQIQENCVTGVRRRAAFGSWVLSGKGGRSP